ncbi:UDP-glucosyltransferase 2 [Drosophila sulfurigaster albostrigata]|uniref:UDP-glucosyltransferase 2 n=1 Tax=Drosophila sulfurigaster albostrigata TaxID=89887 RepID=UPI002D21EC52|nr:UDP-glucosyltransferase 2 [Drosophila sulfurigaster albostrigata]
MVGHIASALAVLGLCLSLTHAAQILAVFSYSFPAPFLLVAPYMKALVQNGHQVTIVSSYNHLEDIEGVRHIRIKLMDQLLNDLLDFDFEGTYPLSKWGKSSIISTFFRNSSYYILSDPKVQGLLRDPNEHFDMIIVQASHTDALYGFAQHFKAPLVGLSAYGTAWNIDYLAGNKAPSVYEPMQPEGYSNGISMFDRFTNWVYITEEWLIDSMVFLPKQVHLYKHFFNRPAESLYEIRHNFSLMLINHHFSLGRARSNVPNVIEIAGMHMNAFIEDLEPELQRFMDEAVDGVIYFSMGLEIVNKWLPPHMLKILEEAFEQLPWHIIWKSELENPIHKSDKIYMKQMLPQRKLLSHPNLKLFITHGGILSIIEAAFSGVPMICVPMYYDQFGNAERMRQAGVAQVLDIGTMTVESTLQAIKEVIENPTYAQKAKQMATRLRDQPMTPLETAVWWTEYVIRHKGAPHMRLSDQDISFMQYYSLDIISMLFGRIGLSIIILSCFSVKLFKLLKKPFQMRLYHIP